MGQVGFFVGDRVNVEKHGPGNMACEKFRASVAPGRWHVPGSVEDNEVGLIQMRLEPLRGHE